MLLRQLYSAKASTPSTRSARSRASSSITACYDKPRYVTKQAAKIMDQESKLDLLLRKMEEVEKKREESEKHRELSEEKSRSEFLALKVAVESRMPVVEKRMDDLHVSVVGLQDQVDKLQSLVQQPPRPSPSSPGLPDGTQTPPQFTSLPSALEQSAFASTLLGASGIGGNVPPMSCPQFNGDSPQLWKSNCEEYFEVYGVHPKNWVRVAGLNFTGNAAFWLQSVRSKLVGVTWQEFYDQVCLRFTKDRQEVLIRQWFHIV